jgi:hypothetical protein
MAAGLLVAFLGGVLAPPACAAEAATTVDQLPRSVFERRLIRFEFDNDTFLKSDDGFSAGWSLQIHSELDDTWGRAWAGWIGRLPGLGDDGAGGRIARWAAGFGQMIFTPREITFEAPQPDDSPWAGVLGASLSWSAYDNRRLGAMQVFLGCIGPCAGGEAVHKFVHETLGIGEPPEGWDNQLADRALANLNYEYRYKILRRAPEAHRPGRFTTDAAAGGEAAVGNLATFVQAQVEFRFGWGVPMGFAPTPDPPGYGIMLDPVYVDRAAPLPERAAWRTWFDVVGRGAWIDRMAPCDGGETVSGGEHPGLDACPGTLQALVGAHVARLPFAYHATWYHYFRQSGTGLDGSNDWVNLTFEWRF